ncbi:hypothetical protein L1049_019042 [Liquidambar formosana]|uniref:non-specific serine/threonine protein kinase n=1 Tax=Liquidambar formosana TaxID=63359 RepID=A0AAP0RCT6_LIQFO
MASLQPPPFPAAAPPPGPPTHHHHHPHHYPLHSRLILPLLASTLALSILILIFILFRKLSRKRTAPSDLKTPHRYSYSVLRSATSHFSPSNRLGQGGFGSVYKGTLPSGQDVAVKVMDSGTLQGEREFNNELSLASRIDSNYVVPILGFSSDTKRRRMVLVYELMHNRSLQDALLDRKCPELMEWKARFVVANDIANGLAYLHSSCDPPVIHGDIKPSNILINCEFRAKIADFGLARLKSDVDHVEVVVEGGSDVAKKKKKEGFEIGEDNGSIIEETESVVTGFEEGGVGGGVDRSPESCVRVLDSEASPEAGLGEVSPSEGLDKTSVSEGCFDKLSVDSGKDLIGGGRRIGRKKSSSGRDWWWKQDNGVGSESGRVKDYVMEWIGTEIKKERPKSEWIASSSLAKNGGSSAKQEQKKHRKRLDWWASLDEERIRKKDKNRKPREWWKEEFCEELSMKNKKKRGLKSSNGSNGGELWWQRDEEVVVERKKRKKSRSRGSIDWWLDGLSGDLRNGRRNSQDWATGDIPKSGGVSSTPSMRGTVCYIAPEYGGGGQLSEKCDVYSFGVLLLVLISGRRPLQVMASPMSEFERANLISWARQLAYNGKLLDLVDQSIQSLDREKALLCITIALLCLQRSPAKRPTMKEIVGMLSGESEPPHLPFEFSPSPPSNFPFRSRKKAR